jgi:hypothetical protein
MLEIRYWGAGRSIMGVNYDYFVSSDGIPSDDVVDTRRVDPVVHLGRLYAELTGAPPIVALRRISPVVEQVPHEVRDALAAVDPERIEQVGAWWAETAEFAVDEVPTAEVTALLHDLVGLSVAARERGESLCVACSVYEPFTSV